MAFLNTDTHLIAYHDSGETYLPALLLAHPLGMNQSVWDSVCDQLHGHYRCIRWDLPGHGGSGAASKNVSIEALAKDALSLADALGIERFCFIGTSIGGMIGQSLCQIAGERLEQVWLTNTGAVIGTPEAWAERAAKVRDIGLGKMAETIVPRWFSPSYVEAHPDALAGWQVQLSRNDDESYAKLCEAIAQMDNRDNLASYTDTVALIAGADDVSTPVAALETLQAQFAEASLSIFDAVGHVPSIEAPSRLVAHIQANSNRATLGQTGVRYEQGLVQRKRILGDAHVERASKNATTLDSPFQQFITRTAWGELWGDASLTVQQRSMITTAILAALGRDGELELHLRTAQRLGIQEKQLQQVLMHVAIYAGVPAANHAFSLAKNNGWGNPVL
ncbi:MULTISPECIES: alpha/beta fold hydrolase [unclassified Psychrobacter]|uniref:bifunctional 3-oxoadipate enol-lactonase/4-carboxymuconolactone decarboxylase PcaDC n=1 Tax=unclassified Psychrobacter TaxID=196806 RepID=UPI0018F5D4DF|nr:MULTISPECIES: alpha/beta fold hydrolase [unclassified Psychrobacter]